MFEFNINVFFFNVFSTRGGWMTPWFDVTFNVFTLYKDRNAHSLKHILTLVEQTLIDFPSKTPLCYNFGN